MPGLPSRLAPDCTGSPPRRALDPQALFNDFVVRTLAPEGAKRQWSSSTNHKTDTSTAGNHRSRPGPGGTPTGLIIGPNANLNTDSRSSRPDLLNDEFGRSSSLRRIASRMWLTGSSVP